MEKRVFGLRTECSECIRSCRSYARIPSFPFTEVCLGEKQMLGLLETLLVNKTELFESEGKPSSG